MAKPTGFLEYGRQTAAERDPLERVADFDEFHLHLEERTLQEQGARCMDCDVPFCHTGQLINGMAAGCPMVSCRANRCLRMMRVCPKAVSAGS